MSHTLKLRKNYLNSDYSNQKGMYGIQQFLHGLRNPKRVLWELGWQYHRRFHGRKGFSPMEEDWDNLVILDACRYDLFAEVNTLEGELRERTSPASSTTEFLHRCFLASKEVHNDIVYVSANPQTRHHGIQKYFHDCVPVWKDYWDEELSTVPPDTFTDQAISAAEEYPEKRLILHYIQPHYPFLGEIGRGIETRGLHGHGVIEDPEAAGESVWDRLEDGELSKNRVWEAYLENLELTLPHVERLANVLQGKTVITSDHGNALGRLGVYGHPSKYYLRELVQVPWLELPYGSRKHVSSAESQERAEVESNVESRLEDLGYT